MFLSLPVFAYHIIRLLTLLWKGRQSLIIVIPFLYYFPPPTPAHVFLSFYFRSFYLSSSSYGISFALSRSIFHFQIYPRKNVTNFLISPKLFFRDLLLSLGLENLDRIAFASSCFGFPVIALSFPPKERGRFPFRVGRDLAPSDPFFRASFAADEVDVQFCTSVVEYCVFFWFIGIFKHAPGDTQTQYKHTHTLSMCVCLFPILNRIYRFASNFKGIFLQGV